jgi:hypothetical protein
MNHGQQTPGLQLQLDNNNPSLNNPDTRYRHRFFYQVGQTYQNYEQRRQKLGTFLENKVF